MSKPRITIVNESDEVIAHKERGTLLQSDIYRVSALWVKNSHGDILLAQRKFTKSHDPGKWGPAVAGTVDEGETYEQNIIKEAEEEIGLKDIQLSLAQKSAWPVNITISTSGIRWLSTNRPKISLFKRKKSSK